MTLRILAPAAHEQPDSSLAHMFGQAMDKIGGDNSGYDIVRGELRTDQLLHALARSSQSQQPVALCGTAFAFVHLIDELARKGDSLLALPGRLPNHGDRRLQGQSREMPRSELYGALESSLGIPQAQIVNQYGMTELGSQFYDSILRHPNQPRRKLAPPWSRVRLLNPDTGKEATANELGIIVIHDLANTSSIAAVQTADLGIKMHDGFEVDRRIPDAEARGCSIAADAMLLGTVTR